MTNTDTGLQLTANRILAEARNAHPDFWVGTRKVFLCAVLDVSNPDVTDTLDECRRAGLLEFSRADLVQAMDPELVADSEWDLPGLAQYHFLIVA